LWANKAIILFDNINFLANNKFCIILIIEKWEAAVMGQMILIAKRKVSQDKADHKIKLDM
jgi:hypothetical protein